MYEVSGGTCLLSGVGLASRHLMATSHFTFACDYDALMSIVWAEYRLRTLFVHACAG